MGSCRSASAIRSGRSRLVGVPRELGAGFVAWRWVRAGTSVMRRGRSRLAGGLGRRPTPRSPDFLAHQRNASALSSTRTRRERPRRSLAMQRPEPARRRRTHPQASRLSPSSRGNSPTNVCRAARSETRHSPQARWRRALRSEYNPRVTRRRDDPICRRRPRLRRGVRARSGRRGARCLPVGPGRIGSRGDSRLG